VGEKVGGNLDNRERGEIEFDAKTATVRDQVQPGNGPRIKPMLLETERAQGQLVSGFRVKDREEAKILFQLPAERLGGQPRLNLRHQTCLFDSAGRGDFRDIAPAVFDDFADNQANQRFLFGVAHKSGFSTAIKKNTGAAVFRPPVVRACALPELSQGVN